MLLLILLPPSLALDLDASGGSRSACLSDLRSNLLLESPKQADAHLEK